MKKYFLKYKVLLGVTIIIILISSCFDIGTAFILKYVIDTATLGNTQMLIRSGTLGLIFMLAFCILKYLRLISTRYYIKKIIQDIRNDKFIQLLNKNITEFRQRNIAEYISKFTNDISIIEKEYLESFFSLITIILNFLLGVSSILIISPRIILVSLGIGIIVLVIPIIFGKSLEIHKSKLSNQLSRFTVSIKDILTGFELIKTYGLANKATEEFRELNKDVEESKYIMHKCEALLSAVSSAANYMSICILLIVVGLQIIEGKITVGFAIAILQLLDYIINPIHTIGIYLNKIKTTSAIIHNLNINDSEDFGDLADEYVEIDEFNKDIIMENVNYSYVNNEENVLKNINFKFEKNKKYVVVGNSGGGKSTLLQLLAGNLRNYHGHIKFDDMEMKNIKVECINKVISIIYQDTFLFDDNIINNITLFDSDISDEILNKIIIQSGLLKMINEKKGGLQFEVGENGAYLSGGEKKRIAIARSLIKGSQIILLDEAFSSLDAQIAYEIENSLLMMKNLTLISITHNLSKNNLVKYDCIIVVKDGNIEEYGTFKELMDKTGYFYSLYNLLYGGI